VGTNPTDKRFKNILDAWDVNDRANSFQGQLQSVEFSKALERMDIDGDLSTSELEISAYFMRNADLICRPVRDTVLQKLKVKEIEKQFRLLNLIDSNRDQKITVEDLPKFFSDLDSDSD